MNPSPGRRKHSLPRFVWRFVSGASMDGRSRTDAGWLARGTQLVHGVHRASRWSYQPRLRRAGVRLGVLTGAGCAWWAYATHPLVVLTVAAAGVACLLGVLGWRAFRAIRQARHHRTVVQPLFVAAAGLLDWPGPARAGQVVRVPASYEDDETARVRISIPDAWHATDEQRKALTALVERRLGGEWDPRWHLTRSPMHVEYKRAPAPPDRVSFEQVRAEFDAGPPGQPVLGLGTRGNVIRLDMDAEAPHVGLSIGTGGGKSSILRLLIAYLIRHGAERIDIIDPKLVSLDCFEGVPGVFIHTDIESQWRAVSECRAAMDERYAERQRDKHAVFPRRVLIIEEQNSFAAESFEHWETVRAKSDPKRPPVFRDLSYVLFKGRQACVNVVSVFQQMNARATGGSDLRDQYGMKLLARFSVQAWNMLVGTSPRPRSSKHPGRGVVVLGDDLRHIQFAFIGEEEAREYALNGREPASVCPWGEDSATSGPDAGPERLRLVPTPELADDEPATVVGLQDAAAFLGLSFAAFEKARQRAKREAGGIPGEFVKNGSPAWTGDALTAWQENRPRAGATAAG